jgi:hypothetical protein
LITFIPCSILSNLSFFARLRRSVYFSLREQEILNLKT